MPRKVFVSGCFDLLHSGHLAFLEKAAEYGELYVSIGSDRTFIGLKNKTPYTTEQERVYMVKGIRWVEDAFIANGEGILDFQEEIEKINPDIFIVNNDGDTEEKRELCLSRGIDYIVLEREPKPGLPARNSTEIRESFKLPYRIDLAGGWLDQPYVSKYHSGQVLTISIEPTRNFNLRSGMATSTRNKAIKIWEKWGDKIPLGDEEFAKLLFCYDNPPGTLEVSGSQDAIGIVMPGLNCLDYEKGEYWPRKITPFKDESLLNWIESSIYLVQLKPREGDFRVLDETNISEQGVKKLADATERCLEGILSRNIDNFGRYFRESFEAQVEMFPRMIDRTILEKIKENQKIAKGWKLSGAGGGGYLIFVSENPPDNSIRIKIRR